VLNIYFNTLTGYWWNILREVDWIPTIKASLMFCTSAKIKRFNVY